VTLAYSDATTITAAVVALFALLALVAVARMVLKTDRPRMQRFRVGIFVEREDDRGADTPDDAHADTTP
jgi:hypothetical protein